MGITERTTVIRRRRTLAAILAAKYRDSANDYYCADVECESPNDCGKPHGYGVTTDAISRPAAVA